jgi:hypothetical protein
MSPSVFDHAWLGAESSTTLSCRSGWNVFVVVLVMVPLWRFLPSVVN